MLKLYFAYGRCMSFCVVIASSKEEAAHIMWADSPEMFEYKPTAKDIDEREISKGVCIGTLGDI